MTRRTLATTFPPVTMTSLDGSTRTLTLNQTSPGGRLKARASGRDQ